MKAIGVDTPKAEGSSGFRLAVFDLDGTLADTIQDLACACNRALSTLGHRPHSVESYCLFVGDGVDELCRRALPAEHRTQRDILALRELFSENYAECCTDNTVAYEGVLPTLDALRIRGIQLAVFSNKPHAMTQKLTEILFPGRFSLVFGKREDAPKKPNPKTLIEIMETLGVSPQQTAYFGDSGVDMRTGKNGGVYTVGCLWGFRQRDELLEGGADHLIGAPPELLNLF